MRHPQLLIYEKDGRLAELLRELAQKQRWALREVRKAEECRQLLRAGGPAVLVLKIGHDLIRELTLLERISWLVPDAGRIVVGDADDPVLAGLAWDLGASYVLFLPGRRNLLPDLVLSLMAASRRAQPAADSSALRGSSTPATDAGAEAAGSP
jgi:DNA-binding NtrC family response regulator